MRKPLHILYIGIIVSVLLTSCGLDGSSFRIKGRFRDMQAGELYIYNLSTGNARFDTLTVQEGKFLYRGEADEVTPYMLVFPNGVEQVIFVGPGQDLAYEAAANDLKNYVVEGSEENELMNQFRQETYTLNPSATATVARTYIKEHPTSFVAIYLFDKYFSQAEQVSNDELKSLLKELKAKHPHHHALLDIDTKVTSAEKRAVGKKLPNVTLTQKDHTTAKLWAKESDFTLIAFWSLWMPGGYDFLWKLGRCHDEYRDGGKLRIVAVSLDIERSKWEEAIRQDTLRRTEHYCDGMNFESKVVKTLGINAIPFYILTDAQHQVLDSGDDASKLDAMLKKHLRGEDSTQGLNAQPSKIR